MNLIDKKKKRHLKHGMGKGPRAFLPNGVPWTGAADVSPSFKQQLLLLFNNVELIDIKGTVHLYTVVTKGTTIGEDVLVHEFRIHKPIGPWLLEYLLKHDAYRNLPMDKEKKVIAFDKKIDEYEKNQEYKINTQFSQLSVDAGKLYSDRAKNRVYI